MRTILSVFIAIGWLLAACSNSTSSALTTTATRVEETESIVNTEPAPHETEEFTAADLPTSSGVVIYKIVPGDSSLVYEVGEVFLNRNNQFNVAVGSSPQIEGEIQIDASNPQNSSIGTITADISQFRSDSPRRDSALQDRFIESARYPTVTFIPTSIEGLPVSYQEGEEIPLVIKGNLTIREVTQPVTFDAIVKLDGSTLSGEATTTILMSDYGFGPIDIGGILKTEDEAKVTLIIIAKP